MSGHRGSTRGVVPLVLILALAVAGCGGDSGDGSAGAATAQAPASTPESTPESTPTTQSTDSSGAGDAGAWQATLAWADTTMSFGLPMCEHTNDSELVVSGTDDEGSILMVNISDGAGEVSVYGKDLQVIVEGTAESFEGTMNADELLDFTAAGSVNDASGTFELTGTCAPTDYLSGSSE